MSLLTVIFVSAVLGGIFGSPVQATPKGEADVESSAKLLTQLLGILEDNYATEVDPDKAVRLAEQWGDAGPALGVALDIEECFDRNIAKTVTEYVDREKGEDAEVTVIIPRREYPRPLQRLLHDQTSRAIARALMDEPHVDVVAVPYRLGDRRSPSRVER